MLEATKSKVRKKNLPQKVKQKKMLEKSPILRASCQKNRHSFLTLFKICRPALHIFECFAALRPRTFRLKQPIAIMLVVALLKLSLRVGSKGQLFGSQMPFQTTYVL